MHVVANERMSLLVLAEVNEYLFSDLMRFFFLLDFVIFSRF